MGKYDAVILDLPKLPPSDLSYQDKVDKAKETIIDRDATALASSYARLRTGSGRVLSQTEVDELIDDFGKDGLARLLYVVNIRIVAHEQLLDASQNEGALGWGTYGVLPNALRLSSGDTVRVERKPYGKVVDKEVFRLWCIANGYERQLQLWPSTMNSLVKERLVAGEEPPEGTEAYSYAIVKLIGK